MFSKKKLLRRIIRIINTQRDMDVRFRKHSLSKLRKNFCSKNINIFEKTFVYQWDCKDWCWKTYLIFVIENRIRGGLKRCISIRVKRIRIWIWWWIKRIIIKTKKNVFFYLTWDGTSLRLKIDWNVRFVS